MPACDEARIDVRLVEDRRALSSVTGTNDKNGLAQRKGTDESCERKSW